MRYMNHIFCLLVGLIIGFGLGFYISAVEFLDLSNSTTETEEVSEGTYSVKKTYKEGDEGFDAQAITLTSYTADIFDHITVKNNTDKVISMYTYRIMYYDMKGTMLDYDDFTFREEIDPQMSRANENSGYGDLDYVYYKTNDNYNRQHKKHYTIKYELKSYTFK